MQIDPLHLAPRQRAVLLLRDVPGFRPAEVASMLDASEVSVNSGLQRARRTMAAQLPGPDREHAPLPHSARERNLAARFAAAFTRGDIDGVVALPAPCLVVMDSGPLSAASRMPQASASALSGLTSTTPPQSVSGRPPSSEAMTRQPACWASIETMPEVSCQYWLLEGISTMSWPAISTAILPGVLQVATTEIPGCSPSNRSMIFPCGLSAPAVVAVNVSAGSCAMMSICSAGDLRGDLAAAGLPGELTEPWRDCQNSGRRSATKTSSGSMPRSRAGREAAARDPFALVDETGALTGPFNAMLLQPGLGAALEALGSAVRFQGRLPGRARELAILVVAAHWASAFEQHAHEAAGRQAGLTEAELAAVRAGEEPGLADPAERAAVQAARALVRAGDLDDEEYAAAVAELGEAGVFELTTLVGYYVTLALQLRVFRVDAPG